MKRLYVKNELLFSLFWIIAYVVLFSTADNISIILGITKIITTPISVIITVFLIIWIKKNHLTDKYGMCKAKICYYKYIYFIPLVIISSSSLWGGIEIHFNTFETALYLISMICVGIIEEIIFRGFLFKALCKNNPKQAVVISSVTFGIGHIVNIFNGAAAFETLLQICSAIAIGFLFTIIFYKTKSIIPCIVSHSAINSLSIFADEVSATFNIAITVIVAVISFSYAIYIKNIKDQ